MREETENTRKWHHSEGKWIERRMRMELNTPASVSKSSPHSKSSDILLKASNLAHDSQLLIARLETYTPSDRVHVPG